MSRLEEQDRMSDLTLIVNPIRLRVEECTNCDKLGASTFHSERRRHLLFM